MADAAAAAAAAAPDPSAPPLPPPPPPSDGPPPPVSENPESGAPPSSEKGEEGRGQWGNQIQFILSCIGFAVGLGNIWRFPYLAYENGGGAFLFVYMICGVFFGLPMLYLELTIGQYLNAGPVVAFKKIMPAFSGLGWSMAVVSLTTSLYYNVIIAWVLLYIIDVIIGSSWTWTVCDNSWNNEYCYSTNMDLRCDAHAAIGRNKFWNGSCYTPLDHKKILAAYEDYTASPSEQFFNSRVMYSFGVEMGSFSNFNWQVALALFILWVFTVFVLLKGVKWMGMLSYLTATVPYVIIVIMFVRGVTLQGAMKGIEFYLLNPDFSFMLEPKTWGAALTQMCFSLSVGYGGLLSMASYNAKNHNVFRDALIVVAADSGMSIFGGVACFSILGYLAEQRGTQIKDVVASGMSLAFVVYPEAMATMPVSWLWSLLFFIMLLLLGVSTLVALTEVFFTCVNDAYPSTKKYKWAICLGTGLAMTLAGLLLCFESGIMWLNLISEYTCAALTINSFLEVVFCVWVRGVKNYIVDMRTMFGEPKNAVSRIIGPTGYWIYCNVMVTAPVLALVVSGLSMESHQRISQGKGEQAYLAPDWHYVIGWIIDMTPVMMIPIFMVVNYFEFRKAGRPASDLFHMDPTHPSHPDYKGAKPAEKEKTPPAAKDPNNNSNPFSDAPPTSTGAATPSAAATPTAATPSAAPAPATAPASTDAAKV